MKFGLLGGEVDGEYCGIGFMEISKISAMLDAFFFGTGLFDRIISYTGHIVAVVL